MKPKPGLSLYWDGYGLAAAASGIHVHGRYLAQELSLLGAPPTVIGPRGSALLFGAGAVVELSGTGLSARALTLKPVWPEAVARRVEQLRGGDQSPYILHGLSNFNAPYRHRDPRRRSVVTVHDLIPFIVPEGVSTALRLQLAWLMPRALARADQVVCVSEWTKRTLIERFPSVAGRCQVIPNGLVLPTRGLEPARDVAAKGDPGVRSIEALYISRYETYKQHARLIAVVRSGQERLRLTLVTDEWGERACRELGADLVAAGRLRFARNLSQDEIAAAHAASDLYLSPSLYEGFCLPAASSLLAGKPVVYIAGSGIDEVVGDQVGVPLARGASLEEWHAGIAQALAMSCRPDFPELVRHHLATLSTWKDAASRLLSLYHSLVA